MRWMQSSMRSLLFASLSFATAQAAAVWEPAVGTMLSISPTGVYYISVQDPAWMFGGNIGHPLENVRVAAGTDGIGEYDEISFQFQESVQKEGAIRLYKQKRIVLFTLKLFAAGENYRTFPKLSYYPRGFYHLTNAGWMHRFDQSETDGPLVEFDSKARAFILSPASNFMIATTSIEPDQDISSGPSPKIQTLPAGFTHRTMLVVENGINLAFDTWGHALTDLHGKVRPTNDADITLSHLGYWTDNGGKYYYHFESALGYEGTLLAIRDEFVKKGVPLGYLQLDSWFYPKGPTAIWNDGNSGIYEYHASPELFPKGLKAFQEQLGVPLVTHARWIDPSSPYRHEYHMSNNVVVDPRYWDAIMSYLRESGVTTYEQTGSPTGPKPNLTLPIPTRS
jgi:hypothetical protein